MMQRYFQTPVSSPAIKKTRAPVKASFTAWDVGNLGHVKVRLLSTAESTATLISKLLHHLRASENLPGKLRPHRPASSCAFHPGQHLIKRGAVVVSACEHHCIHVAHRLNIYQGVGQ